MITSITSQLNSANQGSSLSTRKTGGTLGKDDFMRLLVAQLSNQDPLSPADPQEFASQLAQFSTLEQQINMNESLSDLTALQSSINSAQAASFIGKEVKAFGKTVTLGNGQAGTIRYELAGEAKTVQILISDASGKLVRTIDAGPKLKGSQEFAWDGKDDTGATLPDGAYTFSIGALDPQSKPIAVNTYSVGIVDGISFSNGMTYLVVAGQLIALSDVMEIREPSSSNGAAATAATATTTGGTLPTSSAKPPTLLDLPAKAASVFGGLLGMGQ